jgi:glycosyltransferase involved in cell wall biosynthesis
MLSPHVPERIIYVAHSARNVHEAVGYAADKGIVIPNGYPVPARSRENHLRRELGVPGDALLVGSAGRFNPQKNHRSFIAAAALVAEREPRARFVLMGPGIESWNTELVQWVNSSGFEDRFHLFGDRRDLTKWLAGLDLFCLHSLSEGFPNVVAEAMSVGIPCVVTDVGDAAFLVGDTGTIVPPNDAAALADAILELIAGTPVQRLTLGSAARQRIIDNFSMDAIRARYEGLYASLGSAEPLDDSPDRVGGRMDRAARLTAARDEY